MTRDPEWLVKRFVSLVFVAALASAVIVGHGTQVDGEETTAVTEHGDFEFQGKPSVAELPARKCPECDEVTAL